MESMVGTAAALAAEASALSLLVPAHSFPLTRRLVAAELSRVVAATTPSSATSTPTAPLTLPPASPVCGGGAPLPHGVGAAGGPPGVLAAAAGVGSPISAASAAASAASSNASLSPYGSPAPSPSMAAYAALPPLPSLTPQHGAGMGTGVGVAAAVAPAVSSGGLGGPPPTGCMDASAAAAAAAVVSANAGGMPNGGGVPPPPPPPPPAVPLTRKRAKILIPTSHPRVNFIGKLLGPRGSSLRSLERSTGTRIMIRGRGSIRPEREPAVRGRPGWEHLSEALHVVIEAEGDEATAARALRRAREAVGLLLVPVDEERDELKKQQRRDLAILNGRCRGELSEAVAARVAAGGSSPPPSR